MRGSFARIASSLMIAVCVAIPMVAADVVNGSFEEPYPGGPYQYLIGGSTAIAGWQTMHTGAERFAPAVLFMGSLAQDGAYVLDLNTDYGTGGGVQQTIATEIGRAYTLSYYVGTFADRDRTGTANVDLVINGVTYPNTVVNPTLVIEWTGFATTFVATSGSTTIAFQSFDVPVKTFALLDDVSIAGPFMIDADNDGVLDDVDECPHSDASATVVIDGCDTGVPNTLSASGCTLADQIAVCGASARNHGQFVSCVSYVTNQLKKSGVITGRQKGAIESCAAKSNTP